MTSSGEHLPLALFLTTVVPDAVGLGVNGGQRYGPVNPIEAVGFLGAAALVLVVTAVVLRVPRGSAPDRSPRWFLAGAAAVAAAAIWMGGPVLWALQQLPFYSDNFIGRATSVFGFLGAALAGIGLDRVLRWVAINRQPSPEDAQETKFRSGACPNHPVTRSDGGAAGRRHLRSHRGSRGLRVRSLGRHDALPPASSARTRVLLVVAVVAVLLIRFARRCPVQRVPR